MAAKESTALKWYKSWLCSYLCSFISEDKLSALKADYSSVVVTLLYYRSNIMAVDSVFLFGGTLT